MDTNPILVTVVDDLKWNPFDSRCREVFEDRTQRQINHHTWIDKVEKKLADFKQGQAQAKKIPAQRKGY